MLQLDDLRVFVAVTRARSFVAASKATGIPTSSVSRAVARLEESVGAPLLRRTSRQVVPTSEGERLFARVAPAMEQLVSIASDAESHAREPAGRLRVTAPIVSGSGWIGRSLLAFAEAHPRVELELHLTNAVVDLVRDGFDLGFRAGPVRAEDLVARPVWRSEYALAASPSFVDRALAGRRRLARGDLERLPAIVHAPRTRWTFVDGERRTTIAPNAHVTVDDPRLARDAAARGLGIVRLARDLDDGALVTLDCELGAFEPRSLYVVRPAGRAPRRVRLAIDWVARDAP